MKLLMTGFEQVDRELAEIAAEDGAKSINKAIRREMRDGAKKILPDVLALVPEESGFLASQLKVRALPRSRSFMGAAVTFPDPAYRGETFYGGFIEFGFKHYRAGPIEPDSYLRRAGYGAEDQVRSGVRRGIDNYINQRNRDAPNLRNAL
ncbi:MAG: hypothetical protein AAGJ46_12165 [Planctomycetota bacterium]